MPKLLTAKEAAKRLGVTSKAIADWARKGYFPGAYKTNPHALRSSWNIPEEAVTAFDMQRRGQYPAA